MLKIYYVEILIWGIYVVKAAWSLTVSGNYRPKKEKMGFQKLLQKQQDKSAAGLDRMMRVFYQRGKLSPVDHPSLID